MFGKEIRKIGTVKTENNSGYYNIRELIKEFTESHINNRDKVVEKWKKDIHDRIFVDCIKDGELSNTSIRYMNSQNRINK